jgi:hypothetical protein
MHLYTNPHSISFHSIAVCIDRWLVRKPACPICVRSVNLSPTSRSVSAPAPIPVSSTPRSNQQTTTATPQIHTQTQQQQQQQQQRSPYESYQSAA